jgi:beta-glucosidase-like glycosyl hydrolase
LFIGSDAEWGLNMRLDSISLSLDDTWSHPRHEIIRACAQMGAKQAIGFAIHFAPVLDINTNPEIPS